MKLSLQLSRVVSKETLFGSSPKSPAEVFNFQTARRNTAAQESIYLRSDEDSPELQTPIRRGLLTIIPTLAVTVRLR
jgi:hypothetical protein